MLDKITAHKKEEQLLIMEQNKLLKNIEIKSNQYSRLFDIINWLFLPLLFFSVPLGGLTFATFIRPSYLTVVCLFSLIVPWLIFFVMKSVAESNETERMNDINMLQRKFEQNNLKLNELRLEIVVEEKRISKSAYEKDMLEKGLEKFVSRFGKEKWGTPREVFVWGQQEKGLFLFEDKWITKIEKEQILNKRGLYKFVDRLGNERWGTNSQVEKWKKTDIGLKDNFSSFNPRQFEKFVGELFAKMGYTVQIADYVKDYGIDLVLKKNQETIVVEVKKWRTGHNVGATVVRSVLGAMWKVKADKSIIVTTSSFTVEAEEQAKEAPVELWNVHTLHRLVTKYFIDSNH